jgi:hypothetical protein
MKTKVNKKDSRTWGVDDLIPEPVLKRMASTRGFDASYAHESAKSLLERLLWGYTEEGIADFHPAVFKNILMESLQEMLERLHPDPRTDNLFELGSMLEIAFVVKMMEDLLNPSVEKKSNSAKFRGLKRHLKSRTNLKAG